MVGKISLWLSINVVSPDLGQVDSRGNRIEAIAILD
jgi:hypothetical protein